MKKTIVILSIVGVFALVVFGASSISAATQTHWASKYVEKMISDQILPKTDTAEWDKPVTSEAAVDALSKALGKSISPIDAAKFNRAEFTKVAVDNSAWAADLEQMKFPAWCMSNDQDTIPEEYVPYINMAYRPKYDFMTYRKGRMTGWQEIPTFAEVAFLCYRFKYQPNTDPGQQIVVVTAQEPETMNATSNALSRTMLVTFLSFGGDVSYGDDATLYPVYLTRVPSVDNGDVKIINDPATGRQKEIVTYHIRPGIYQHPMYEGEPDNLHELTADEYIYAVKEGICPRILNTSKSGVWKIDSYRKVDKYTIETVWNEVYAYATWGTNFSYGYQAKFEQDLYTDPADFNVRQDGIDYVTGPYKMVKWDRGDHIEFAPNPKASYCKPLIDKIIVRFMSDTNTIRLNLQSNSVDIVSNAFTPIEASGLAQSLPQYKFVYTEGTSWEHLDLNQYDTDPLSPNTPACKWVFGDKRVRQAMLYALNREELCKVVSNGVFTPSNSWMPAKSQYYNDSLVKKYPYDPAMAEKLLDEAGWTLTKVGSEMIRCKGGDPKLPFMFEIKTTSEQEFRVKNIEQMQKMWARVGLKIVTKPVPAKELFGQSLTRHEWQIVEFAWVSNPIRPNANLFMSNQIPTNDNFWQGQNIGGWPSSKEHDALCTKMTMELPEKELQAVYDNQSAIWTEEVPAIPLFNRYDVDVCPTDLENFKPTGSQMTPNWNSAWWYREIIK
ncbi:MAG: peptide ABC transporter substrate-binding protein [Caldisericia bacterium]|nr:peptide ABC transporter substrate-binding protein [Caldisericia bacterium]